MADDKPNAAKSRAVYWRCFHCGETFTRAQVKCARDHFGSDPGQQPVCLMREPGEYHVLRALRSAEDELASYRAEDTELHRALHAMADDHARALIWQEQRGYDKALRDIEAGKVEPAHAETILAAMRSIARAA